MDQGNANYFTSLLILEKHTRVDNNLIKLRLMRVLRIFLPITM
jgi:hypothetical protein